MRRIGSIFLGIFLLCQAGLGFTQTLIEAKSTQAPITIPSPPQLQAKSYALIDAHSKQLLAARDADVIIHPASLTKMMTAYIAFMEIKAGRLHLDDKARISEKAWATQGSKTFVEVGKDIPVSVLLHGIITQSGNDASVALAEHIAGTEEAFADLMNTQARRLGMLHTHFTNATGLPHEDHYSTAHDLALLGAALALDFPEHYEMFAEKEFTYHGIRQYNRNTLLWREEGVDGIKTGHTEEAGFCLVASALRNNMRLVASVIGTTSEKSRAQEASALLNYGFRFYETRKLYPAGQTLAHLPVRKGTAWQVPVGVRQDLYITYPKGGYSQLQAFLELQRRVRAPVKAGTPLGQLKVQMGQQNVLQTPVFALEDIPESSWLGRRLDDLLFWR